jgi:hypothetical protein
MQIAPSNRRFVSSHKTARTIKARCLHPNIAIKERTMQTHRKHPKISATVR